MSLPVDNDYEFLLPRYGLTFSDGKYNESKFSNDFNPFEKEDNKIMKLLQQDTV